MSDDLKVLYARRQYQKNLIGFYGFKARVFAQRKDFRKVEHFKEKQRYHIKKFNVLDAVIKRYE